MDTDRLRYFCTIVRSGSIQRASELLHLSPAALSKALKLLESEVNLSLVVRSGRGIVVTEAGRTFASKAERLLQEFESLKGSKLKKTATNSVLRIGSFEVFTTHLLAALLTGPLESADLILYELGPGKMEEALSEGRIDFGITYLPIPHPDLDFMKVTTLKMGVYSSQGNLLKEPLQEIPFAIPVAPIQGTPTKVEGLDGWPDHLFGRYAKYRVTLMESALELCRKGAAAAYLPKFIVDLHNEKVKGRYALFEHSEPLPFPSKYVHQPVYLVKRKSDEEGQTLKQMARALRLIVGS